MQLLLGLCRLHCLCFHYRFISVFLYLYVWLSLSLSLSLFLSALTKNVHICSYYWGFAAYIAYHINHPLYTAPSGNQVGSAFIHAFIQPGSFTHSLIFPSLTIRSTLRLLANRLVQYSSFIYSLLTIIRAFMHPFIRAFMHSFISAFMHSFKHSLVH